MNSNEEKSFLIDDKLYKTAQDFFECQYREVSEFYKKIFSIITFLLFIIVFTLLALSISLNIDSEKKSNDTNNLSSITEESSILVEIQEDPISGKILSKRVYDKENKLTYIYTYNYSSDEWSGLYCESTYVTIIDARGRVLNSSVE